MTETVVMTFEMMIKSQTHFYLRTMKKSLSVEKRLQIHLVVKSFCIWEKRTDVRLILKWLCLGILFDQGMISSSISLVLRCFVQNALM